MFTNDLVRAEQVRQQVESAPLQVKVRYLTEYMASDQTRELSSLNVPLLALVPAFNEKVLAQPANGFFKMYFQDSWAMLPRSPQLQRTTIPDARALLLDDQPKLADDAITTFVEHLSRELI